MIRVLIVDDSAVVRRILADELSRFPDIEIVGTAVDPFVARDKIVQLNPDVITLDVEMPRMDGLTFLSKLMQHHPIPVVIVSSLTPEGSAAAFRAFELGAVEVVSKPSSQFSTPDVANRLIHAIRAAAIATLRRVGCPAEVVSRTASASILSDLRATHKILAIGASTGGTQAVESVLRQFPPTIPGTLVVQHMPPQFTSSFAERLNRVCAMEVREARDGENVVPGKVLLAPGGHHMVLVRDGARYVVEIKDGPPVYHQKPSVDVMFNSVAASAGRNATGILLTGMGADGAKGLLALRQAGGYTIAEDESTCVVFGMPKEAIALDAAITVCPLHDIPEVVLGILRSDQRKSPAST